MKTKDILVIGGVGLGAYLLIGKTPIADTGGAKIITETIPEFLTQYIPFTQTQYIPQPATGNVADLNWLEQFLAGFTGKKEGEGEDIISVPDVEGMFSDLTDKVREWFDAIPKPDVELPDMPKIPKLPTGNGGDGGLLDKFLGLFDIDLGFEMAYHPNLDIDKAFRGVLPGDDRGLIEKLFGLSEGQNLWDLWSEKVSGWQEPAKKGWHSFWAGQGEIDERIAADWRGRRKDREVYYPEAGSGTDSGEARPTASKEYRFYREAGYSAEDASDATLAEYF